MVENHLRVTPQLTIDDIDRIGVDLVVPIGSTLTNRSSLGTEFGLLEGNPHFNRPSTS